MMLQIDLCDAPVPAPSPRPKHLDPDVLELSAKSALPAVKRYLGKEYPGDHEILEDLLSVLGYPDQSGFEIYRRLRDYKHWDDDRELVDLGDSIECAAREALSFMISRWIETFRLSPIHTVGDEVTLTYNSGRRVGTHHGSIIDIDLKRACYTVCIPSQGHVIAGVGTMGWVIPWEELDT